MLCEAALRFLAEMGVPKNYPVVEKGLKITMEEVNNEGNSNNER